MADILRQGREGRRSRAWTLLRGFLSPRQILTSLLPGPTLENIAWTGVSVAAYVLASIAWTGVVHGSVRVSEHRLDRRGPWQRTC